MIHDASRPAYRVLTGPAAEGLTQLKSGTRYQQSLYVDTNNNGILDPEDQAIIVTSKHETNDHRQVFGTYQSPLTLHEVDNRFRGQETSNAQDVLARLNPTFDLDATLDGKKFTATEVLVTLPGCQTPITDGEFFFAGQELFVRRSK